MTLDTHTTAASNIGNAKLTSKVFTVGKAGKSPDVVYLDFIW